MGPTTSFAKLLPAFGNAMFAYHSGTAQHSERVGALARRIGVEVGLGGPSWPRKPCPLTVSVG